MKGIALAAASSAVLALTTGCTHNQAPKVTSARSSTTVVIAPVSCRQQYSTWAKAGGTAAIHALDAVTSATTDQDRHRLRGALKRAQPILTRAAQHPIPACADARGYWPVLLMHVSAASASTDSSPTVKAALQDVPAIHQHLRDEVKQSVG
jgi:hypothetical protein